MRDMVLTLRNKKTGNKVYCFYVSGYLTHPLNVYISNLIPTIHGLYYGREEGDFTDYHHITSFRLGNKKKEEYSILSYGVYDSRITYKYVKNKNLYNKSDPPKVVARFE